MGLSISEIDVDFNRKSQKIPRLVFCVPAEGVPLGIGYRCRGSKTRMMVTWPTKKFDDIVSRLDRIHERDGQTD